MENIMEETKESFRRKIQKGPLSKSDWKFDSDNPELFKKAVYQAYLDAARTFFGMKGNAEEILTPIADNIQQYFKNSEPDSFDELHHKWCDKVLELFRKNGYNAKYGQAQKIVNMTFKYLYCCDKSEEKTEYFKPCHMPLDSFTLEWFKRTMGNKLKVGRIKESWSTLEYKSENDNNPKSQDKYSYSFYFNKIKEISQNENKTPLELELTIWPEMKRKLAAESFLFSISDDYSRNDLKNMKIEELWTEIRKIIS